MTNNINLSFCPRCKKQVKVAVCGFNSNYNIPIRCGVCGIQLGIESYADERKKINRKN
jgi:transcription elongation factor Elf1